MRITIVNSFFPPWRGGAETYVYNLSKRTAIYTTYGQISNDGKAAFSVLPGAPYSAQGGSSKGYNVGVKHSF